MDWNWAKEQMKEGIKVRRTTWVRGTYYTLKEDTIWTYISTRDVIMKDYVGNVSIEELEANNWALHIPDDNKSNEETNTEKSLNEKQKGHISFIMSECEDYAVEVRGIKKGCGSCAYKDLCKSIIKKLDMTNTILTPKPLRD